MALFTNKELYSFWEECKQTQCSTDLVLFIFLPDNAVHFIKKQGLHTKNETSFFQNYLQLLTWFYLFQIIKQSMESKYLWLKT